jgi:RNA polymerase sigma factor for flagellar operon FliA
MSAAHTLNAPVRPASHEEKARRTLSRSEYERFLPLVRRIAMRTARKVPRHIALGDLTHYGWVGLLEAFARADPEMPEREFEAYAGYRIRGAMLDYLRGLDPLSREMRESSRRISNAIAELTRELNRTPEESEIARKLNLTEEGYRALLSSVATAGMARLELADIDEESIPSQIEGPDDEAERKSLTNAVADAITTLPTRLQQMLTLHYQQGCTFREIGAVFGVSESRISQLHTEAIHRIRAAIEKE